LPRDEEAPINVVRLDGEDEESEPKKSSVGIKKAKQMLRRGGAAEICVEAIEKLWANKVSMEKEKEKVKEERFKQTIELDKAAIEVDKAAIEVDKERASNEAKLAEAKLMKEEKEIMQVDKSKLDSVQLEYYEMM
jgi:hypothetical protein